MSSISDDFEELNNNGKNIKIEAQVSLYRSPDINKSS
jgi:hypothetical protein